ncbi:hypothetical protein NDN08_006540 [Rhodosorus marinus]|uniref:Translocation protein SEC62 n=1 Tax=Rhodosorus marinus TaxID=101924 RepID=A0AAV8ULI1_9RHOD|nr:hypothetical protein NDN08_006540 [Rhodosorus marinus]
MGKAKPKFKGPQKEMTAEQAEKLRKWHDVALSLRKPGTVDWREAVVSRTRVEYFRGKDMAEHLKSHTATIDNALDGIDTASMPVDEQVQLFMTVMIQMGLAIRADRVEADRTPRQGKKGLIKWPKKLLQLPGEDQVWNPKAFYIWSFARPTSPWLYLGSISIVLLVAAVCLYPLAPLKLKWQVISVLSVLLILMFVLIALRGLIYAVIWLATGRHVWLLPLFFADVSVRESFSVLIAESVDDDGKPVERSPFWTRLVAIAVAVAVVHALRSVAPDRAATARRVKRMNRSVMEYFELLSMDDMAKLGGASGDFVSEADAANIDLSETQPGDLNEDATGGTSSAADGDTRANPDQYREGAPNQQIHDEEL